MKRKREHDEKFIEKHGRKQNSTTNDDEDENQPETLEVRTNFSFLFSFSTKFVVVSGRKHDDHN